jgi:DNA-binding response OmpR family regulator
MDLESEELRRSGIKLKLSGQPFHMLAMIAVRDGRVVTYEELEGRFWPQTHIEDPRHSNRALDDCQAP